MAAVLLDDTVERHGLMCWPGTAHVAAAIALAVDAAVAVERERCARIAEQHWDRYGLDCLNHTGISCFREIAAAIRTPGAA